MGDLDPVIVAAVLLEFCFDLCRVADEKKFIDVPVLTQRHDGASDEVRRAKVTAHRIQGDLHRCEILQTRAADCKAKNAEAHAATSAWVL